MKNKKKRILVATDASFLSSGYGIYAKEILSRFHKNENYEVAELACYATVESPQIKNIPWKVYPNAVINKDERFQQYKNNASNQFGSWRFNRILLDFQPDIVLTWTDYWMYNYQEISPLRRHFTWIQMPMIDSAPQKIEWLYTYCNADCILPYTNWAKQTLSNSCGHLINLYPQVANAGINPEEFFPINNKNNHKISYFGEDITVIGSVMRNQKRKLFAELFDVFKNYLDLLKKENKLEQYNKTHLYLHTSYPEENGWDLPSLLLEYNLLDKVYFSYICRHCNNFLPSKFQGSVISCNRCGNISACLPSVNSGVSTKILNNIYNLFDFYIQYAIAEGFGMPIIEAASAGVPFAVVDYSAMPEIAENLGGYKIRVQKLFREMETNANRAYPDNQDAVQILNVFFNILTSTDRHNLSIKIREECSKKYTWDNTYQVWLSCIENNTEQNQKIPWNSSKVYSTDQGQNSVPDSLNYKEFVKYICDNIIKEPYLFNTAPIQNLVKDLNFKLNCGGGMITNIDYKKAVEILENHLNNKIVSENARHNIPNLKNEDYLNCQTL
jgi:glycosyltransferase involved in cell wall biosynthesis